MFKTEAIVGLLVMLLATAQASTSVGCYQEDVRSRHFHDNPGDYSPDILTVGSCMAKCGVYDKLYAGLTEGRFCYCSNSLPDISRKQVDDTNCNVPCSGSASTNCGGVRYVSVYPSGKQIAGLTITTDAATNIIETGTPVGIDISVTFGTDVVYKFDYGDGAGKTSGNATGMLTRTFNTPGEYDILVYANDAGETFQDQVDAVAVRVDAPPGTVEVTCDNPLATHELGDCTVIVWSGSSLQCDVAVASAPPIAYSPFDIEDPPLSLAGPPVPAKNAAAGDDASYNYLMLASEFSLSGKILAWELYVETLGSGTVTMMVLQPVCADYCYSDNSCSSSCDSNAQRVTKCPSIDTFCLQHALCADTCTSSASRYSNYPDTYKITHSVALSITATGYQYITESSEILVEPGFIIGLSHTPGDALIGRVPSATDEDDRSFTYGTPVVGGTVTVASTTAVTSVRHSVRAIASGGSRIHLPFTFDTAGNYTLTAIASSKTLPGSSKTGITVIQVQEGINATILDGPQFGTTGQDVEFRLEPHTGNDVFYNWTFGPDNYLMTQLSQKKHVFTTLGTYDVSVTAYNAISDKSNTSTVMIEDEVTGLSISAPDTILGQATNFDFSLTQGSNYTCEWDFGDGSNKETMDEVATPVVSSAVYYSHTFPTIGVYSASVNCSNDVSHATASAMITVQEEITNLRLEKEGADKNTDFNIVILLDKGTDVTCSLTFGGATIPLTQDNALQWTSDLQAGRATDSIPLVVTAQNLVSQGNITLDFKILSRIVDPELIIDADNVSSHTNVQFTVTIASGSDVKVDIDFKDGNSDSYTQPPGVEWTGSQTFTHMFESGGRFQVTATFSNAEDTITRTKELLVLVSAQSIECVMERYSLYHPPAEFSLTLVGSTMPTEPVLTIDWEGPPYIPIQPALVLNTTYNHTFRDTGDYEVNVTLVTVMDTKICTKTVTVVEKLQGPDFQLPLPKAAVNQPFEVVFCLYRGPSGDLCNLTFDFGDGNGDHAPIQRTGTGQSGCDTQTVTYTDSSTKTITVKAVTPLEDTSKSINVEIIIAATDDELTATIPSPNNDFGSPLTFTVEYSGGQTVTANITILFGDGHVEKTEYTFGVSQTFSYTYTQDGAFTAVVTIENEAFKVVKNVSVGIYKTFSSPTTQIYYLADKPPGQKLYGFNGDLTSFPLKKQIWFDVSDLNNAYAESYTLTLTETNQPTITLTFDNPDEIYCILTQHGNYKASVTLDNPRNQVSTPIYDINTFELVEGLSVVEVQLKVKTNEEKLFNVTFPPAFIGMDTCVFVDYGTGAKHIFTDVVTCHNPPVGYPSPSNARFPLSDLNQIGYTYLQEGYYELHVTAINPYSTETKTVGFSITALDCSKPSVDIFERQPYFNQPKTYLQSEHIKIRGLSTINCGTSFSNVKSWGVEEVDPSFDTVIRTIDISGLAPPAPGKAELNIPPRFLTLGLYRITYTMTMSGSYGSNSFSSSTSTYIEVNASPLIGIMVVGGNSEIRRGQGQSLTLDPLSVSKDPDVDPGMVDQGLSVKEWSCTLLDGSADPGCNVITPGDDTQTFSLSSMALNYYQINVTLEKDTRTVKSSIVLDVTSGSPPIVVIQPAPESIVIQESDGYKVLKSSRLSLECLCEGCSDTDQLTYEWSIYLEDYRWPNGWRLLTEEETANRIVGKYSKKISIEPILFDHFNTPLMQAKCQITKAGVTGAVSANLKVNSPPTPGTCTVSPLDSTYTSEKAWKISVSGFADDDGIERYQFFIHTSDDETERQITSEIKTEDTFSIDVSLTEAYAYNDYKEEIFVNVRDNLGGITRHSCGVVVVRPLPLDQIQAISNDILTDNLNEMNRLFAEGDQNTCTEKSISIFSSLNSASKRSRTEYAGFRQASNFAGSMYGQIDVVRPSYLQYNALMNNPEEKFQMDSSRDAQAKVRKSILESLNELETQSVIAIQQVSSCFAEAVVFSDEIVQDMQVTVMDSLNNMLDFIANRDNQQDFPIEDVERILENGVATIGGISDACGSNGYFGTLTELAEAQEDEEFVVYDSSISAGEDLEMEEAGTWDEALALHTARVHKMRQKNQSVKVRQKTIAGLDKISGIFNNISVPSREMDIKTLKMKMKLKKSDEENLKGETISIAGSVGGVTLPNNSFLGSNPDETFVIAVSQATNYPLRYTEFAENRLSPTTNFITVNIYDENNGKKSFSSVSQPFKIIIPHDANMPKPSYNSIDPKITSWNNLMSFVTTLNYTQSALFMDFGKLTGRQLLLVVKKGEEPKIRDNQTDDICDNVFLLPKSTTQDLDDPDRYRFVLDNDFLGDYTGKVYIGVRELNSTEFDMDLSNGCDSLSRYTNGSDYFKGNFSLRQYVSQCLSIGDDAPDWTTGGCKVGKETDTGKTVCYCTHLTTFAGGWVVVPNSIDWSYVFANADFLKNPTIYVTQIVIVVIFIIAAIYSRFKDKELKEKLGIAPLADNDPKDKYFYEILVSTGMRRNAGTNSQVCVILSGEDDETEIRALSDDKRKIFRRGQIDGFLMSVPRPLGYLNFIRIWHDNSGKGKFGSWYLNYIVVRDIQTGVKQIFISNRWFAVEEDDGQVDRVLPVAGKEQLGDFSYQFGERTKKNLADGHLWFSVVARPPQSRFTCLQRVSCILCLLYVTMLANAMFYNTAKEDEQNNSFAIGPFSVSPEQIFIGVISNLIVFPVNFLLIFLFRKSRPHHKRPSRIDRAIKEVSDQNKQTSITDVKPEVSSIFSVSKSPTLPHDLRSPDASRPGTAMSMDNDKTALHPKKKKCELPWYFVIIAWILLWLVTLGAALMVTFYGISFKDETCKKWISSMLVSFFMSVFITQPIKVFLFAVILSIIIKNPGEEKEDEEEDEEGHNTHLDDALLHEEDNVFGAARPRKIGYKPPDPAVLEKHRLRRLKEIKMWSIIREVIMYSFFLWILMVISYGQLGASHFLYKDTMHRVFIANNDTEIDFHKIRNTNEYWTWAKSGLLNGLRAGSYYNDYPPLKLRAYVNDKVSRILGYATLRQVKIKPGICEIPDEMKGIISQCNVKYEIFDQEERSFRPGWLQLRSNETANDTREEYTYSDANSLNGYPYWGILSWYSGGGYVVPLKGSKEDLLAKFDQLQSEDWIDMYTRAVFVEFTVYNAQVNLFAIGTILAEFHPSGGMVLTYRFEPAMLLPYMDSAMLFQIVCEFAFMLFTLYFIIHEIRELLRSKLNYFSSFWNLVELGIISMSVTAIVIYFYRLFLTNDLTKSFKETEGNGYVKFQYVAYWNETFSYIIGMLVFFATLKFMKLLRFNKKITLLSATLKYSARSLLHFSIIFGIVFLAFAQLFYLTYMNIDIDYSTFISSVVASVLMMMGKFNIYTMIMAEPILTQIFVLLFVVSVTFVIVNMFVSILNETFTTVREDIKKQGNDYEIVDFMVQSFRKWTGIGGVPQQNDNATTNPDNSRDNPNASAPDYVQDFPERIDRLLQSISAVYTDNDNFSQMYKKRPFQSGTSNPKRLLGMSSQGPPQAHDLTHRRKDSSDAIPRVHTH